MRRDEYWEVRPEDGGGEQKCKKSKGKMTMITDLVSRAFSALLLPLRPAAEEGEAVQAVLLVEDGGFRSEKVSMGSGGGMGRRHGEGKGETPIGHRHDGRRHAQGSRHDQLR